MTRLRRLMGLIVCGYLSWAGAAGADAVVDWNAITSQAIATATPPRPGPATVLDFAMVHAAVYDAVQAIDGRFEPYHVEIPGASGSPAAAAAKAAHDVLVNRFPAQAATFLDPAYYAYLANNGLAENDPGVAVGQQAAAGIIALRANDGSYPSPPPPPFIGGTDPGVWRPTPSYLPGPPPSNAPMAIPWFGAVTPFTLTSPAQFRAQPPPALTSACYTEDYKEVKALGGDVNSSRTPEQTELAYFWALNFVSQWNLALRTIAATHVDNIGDSARLFALANLASADAGITAWESKSRFVFWRPVTAIQEGNNDGNPQTDGDPTWHPLINTPNYPDYTSGANNITGAMTRSLALFFETDKLPFSVTSNNALPVQKTRTYSHFSDAAQEVVDARIYEGIHFRFADTAARRQGQSVAEWGFKHFLRPVDVDDLDDEENACSAGVLCLGGNRFCITVDWWSPTASGQGHAVSLTPDSGYFWFFDSANVEITVKVLDSCSASGRKWVFAGGLTNLQVVMTVTDTHTGVSKTYTNPQGVPFVPIQDTDAFSTCP